MSISSKPQIQGPQLAGFCYRELPADSAAQARSELSESAKQREAIEAARREGQARAQEIFDQQLASERQMLRQAILDFTRERQGYFQKIEVEVVQLALAIARRVLHREANADPLLLAGIVRVALDKLENKTEVVLRVHPDVASEWRDYFAANVEPRHAPSVVEDPGMEGGRCVVETLLGSTEIGLETQLKEVEQGLMDLQAQRPRYAE